MTLDVSGFVLPVSSREVGRPDDADRQAPGPTGPGADPAPPAPEPSSPAGQRRMLGPAAVATVVAAFSAMWTRGALVLDGTAHALGLQVVLDQFGAHRTVGYWIPQLWAGAPVWAAAPSLPILLVAPLATVLGPDAAVKAAVLGLQVLGGCGTFVLARSLWGRLPASVLAGVLFALQPMVVATGALAGSVGAVAVMAATPWLAWSLRKALRGDGAGHVVLAGLVGGFALLMQVEATVGLAVLGACLVAVELRRGRTGQNPVGSGRILARAAAVGAIAFGLAAYWLLPFMTLDRSFTRSGTAPGGTGILEAGRALVAGDPGLLLSRAGELTGAVGIDRPGLASALFHVGWVCLALTLVTVVLLPRRDNEGGLAAVLLASAVGMWLSTGSVALASGPAGGGARLLAFGVAAAAVGLLVGGLLRPLRAARAGPPLLIALAVLAVAPYLAPYGAMRAVTSFLAGVRFPQAHAAVPLGLALGAAYPAVLVHQWARHHRAGLAPGLAAAVSMAVVGIVVVDVWPSRSYYRVRPPSNAPAYRAVATELASLPAGYRVAPGRVDPGAVRSLADTGRELSVGWPPGIAGEQAWRLTGEPVDGPPLYRDRANGLTSTGWVAVEQTTDRGTAEETLAGVDLVRNASALSLVRTYPQAVVLASREITPELAVGLVYRNIGVVRHAGIPTGALADVTVADVRSSRPCTDGSITELSPGLASQVGVACGLHGWLPALGAGIDMVGIEPDLGAVFVSPADRLQGVSVWLDRSAGRAELALHEVGEDGRSLGRELARSRAVGSDEYGLAAFTFDPVAGSAGRRYAFLLTCRDCPPGTAPRMAAGHTDAPAGNLLVNGTVRGDRAAAFSPLYDPVGVDKASTTAVRWTRPGPGRWRVEAEGADPSLVVVAESWFPGWRATVDGVPATVLEADGAFIGVALTPGAHVIDLRYRRPASSNVGRLVTLATLVACAALALRGRRPRRARPVRLRTAPPAFGPQVRRPGARRPAAPARPVPARRRDVTPDESDWDDVVIRRSDGRSPGGGDRPPRPP